MSRVVSTSLVAAAVRDDDPSRGRDVLAGALAGQIAGLIMAVVVIAVFAVVLDTHPLFPVQVIGSFVFGQAALEGVHGGAVLAGLLLHQLGPALFWGVVFGALVHSLGLRSRNQQLLAGVVIGLVSQVVDVHLLLPFLMDGLHGEDLWAQNVPVFWSWAGHVVYGVALATFPWCAAWLDRRF